MVNTQFFIILFSVFIIPAVSLSQVSFERTYGHEFYDTGYAVLQTADGGYVIAGESSPFGAGIDVYLIRTDPSGDTLWTRTYDSGNREVGLAIQQTTDEGYVIAGLWQLSDPYNEEVYLIRIDSSGDTLWTRTYGGEDCDVGYSVQQMTDGGYVIAGTTTPCIGGSADSADVYLIRTASSGDTLWTRKYGGGGDDWGYEVQQTTDGGYVIAGDAWSFGGGNWDAYLVKTDSSGDTLWTRRYGGDDDQHGRSVQQTMDGGYVIAGDTGSFLAREVYLIKTDSSGDTLWTKRYGRDDDHGGLSVRETTDGGYVIAGNSGCLVNPPMEYRYDVYLIRTDSSGDTLWTKTYGGEWDDHGYSVRQTMDGGYVVVGKTLSFGAADWDVYLIKTDPDGIVDISENDHRSMELPRSWAMSQNYPNPFNPSTTIAFDIPGTLVTRDKVNLSIYDMRGRRVRTLVDSELEPGTHKVHWDGRDDRGGSVASGIYLYTLKAGVAIHTRKMTVLK
jgi:hypothetical protein